MIDRIKIQQALNTCRVKPQITRVEGRYVGIDREPPSTVVDNLAKQGVVCRGYSWSETLGYYLIIAV